MSDNKQTKWTSNWKKENYERYMLEFPKGTKAQVIEHARKHGMSIREYILTLIELDSDIDMGFVRAKEEK